MAKPNKSESGSPPKPDLKKSPKKLREIEMKKEAKNGVSDVKKVTKKVTKGNKSTTSIFSSKLLIGGSILVVLFSVGVYLFIGNWQNGDLKFNKIEEYSISELMDEGIKALFGEGVVEDVEQDSVPKEEHSSKQVISDEHEEELTSYKEEFEEKTDSEETDALIPEKEIILETNLEDNELEADAEPDSESEIKSKHEYVKDLLESLETEQTEQVENQEEPTSNDGVETITENETYTQIQETIESEIGTKYLDEHLKSIEDESSNEELMTEYEGFNREVDIELEEAVNDEVQPMKSLEERIAQHQENIEKIGNIKASEYYKVIGDTGKDDYKDTININHVLHRRYKTLEGDDEEDLETPIYYEDDEYDENHKTTDENFDNQQVQNETESESDGEVENEISPEPELHDESDSQEVNSVSEEKFEEKPEDVITKDLKDHVDEAEDVGNIKAEIIDNRNDEGVYISEEDSQIFINKSEIFEQQHELISDDDELEHVKDALENSVVKVTEVISNANEDINEDKDNLDSENIANEGLDHETKSSLDDQENEPIALEDAESSHVNDDKLDQDDKELGEEKDSSWNEEKSQEFALDQDDQTEQHEVNVAKNAENALQEEEKLEQNEVKQDEAVKDEKELIKDQNEIDEIENLDQEEKYSDQDEDNFIRKDEIQDEEQMVKQEDNKSQGDSLNRDKETQRRDEENLAKEIDFQINEGLKEIEDELAKGARKAVNHYHTKLLRNINDNLAALGKARALSAVWKEEGIQTILEDARDTYLLALGQTPLSRKLSFLVTSECVELLEAINEPDQDVLIKDALSSLLETYPNDLELFYELATTSLEKYQLVTAKTAFRLLLGKKPFDPLVRLHLGSILKTVDKDFDTAVDLILPVVEKGELPIEDSRIFLELGDALSRLGRKEEAKHVYSRAVDVGLLQSPWQHNILTVPGLINKVWWTKDELSEQNQRLFAELENYWFNIREEVVKVVEDGSVMTKQLEDETIEVERGGVETISLFAYGNKNHEACSYLPVACRMIENIPDVVKCQQCEAQIHIIQPNTRLNSYLSPTNARIKADLGLSLAGDDLINVRGETKSWKLGQFLFYDPSFDREWIIDDKEEDDTNGAFANQIKNIALPGNMRAILTLELWHPQLNDEQKEEMEEL